MTLFDCPIVIDPTMRRTELRLGYVWIFNLEDPAEAGLEPYVPLPPWRQDARSAR